MKQLSRWAFWLGVASVVSCAGGTETGNPATLAGFASSGCKNREPAPGQQALVLASDAEGLQCVEWSTTGAHLRVELLNFPEPCGDEYLGRAALTSAGTLELTAYKDSCAALKCGLCVYDLEYELSGVAGDEPLELRVGSAACETEPTTFTDELTLPVDQQASGVLCRYLARGALEWYARGRSACGERNMPCGDCESDATTCAAGLICTALSPNDSRCLPSCASDDDCAGPLTTCQAGVCRAQADWP